MPSVRKDAAPSGSGPTTSAVHVDTPLGSQKGKPKVKGKIMVDNPVAKFAKSDTALRYTLGVVYEPLVKDSQGDLSTAEDIEKACFDFNKNIYQLSKAATAMANAITKAAETGEAEVFIPDEVVEKGALGHQHFNWDDSLGDIVESYIQRGDTTVGDEVIKDGTWMMGVIWSEDMWAKVQKGEITGYSMGGSGKRLPLETENA